MIKRYIKRG